MGASSRETFVMSASPVQAAQLTAARLSKLKGATHPDTVAARAELIALHVERLVETAPPLTGEQVDRITAILRGGAK